MSHIGRYTLAIKGASKEVLDVVFTLFLAMVGGRQIRNIRSFEGQVQDGGVYAFKTKKLPNGAAIQIKDGKLMLVGDSWGVNDVWDKYTKNIEQLYKAAATKMSLEEMGYAVELDVAAETEEIYVRAVR